MRDISEKSNTLRTAIARATLRLSDSTIEMIQRGEAPKGDPLPVAKVAAIQAAKNTSAIIPYCHPLPVEFVGVNFEISPGQIDIVVEVKAIYKTGVEMEALTAASVAALTIYDMTKMVDEIMEIQSVKLESKRGGKSDFRKKSDQKLRAAILVMSDSISQNRAVDTSGAHIKQRLEAENCEIALFEVLPDAPDQIIRAVMRCADELKVDLLVTTGGTGVSPTDHTPEAIEKLIERQLPGVAETIRAYGQQRHPYSMLSRSVAGVRGKTVILSLPGSEGGVRDGLNAVVPSIFHTCKMLAGKGHGKEVAISG